MEGKGKKTYTKSIYWLFSYCHHYITLPGEVLTGVEFENESEKRDKKSELKKNVNTFFYVHMN